MSLDAVGGVRPSISRMLEAFDRYQQQGDAGDFTDALYQFMGDYDQASDETMASIIGLMGIPGGPKTSFRHGQWGEHTEDRLENIQQTMAAYVKACNNLFKDYDIDLSQPFSIVIDNDRQVRVMGDHPDKDKIEGLLNGSHLMRNTAVTLMGNVAQHHTVEHALEGGPNRKVQEFALTFMSDDGTLAAAIYFGHQKLHAMKKGEDLAEADAADMQLAEGNAAEEAYLHQKQQQEDWLKDKLLRDEASEKAVEKAVQAVEAAKAQPATYI
jgi:hypothetical protein